MDYQAVYYMILILNFGVEYSTATKRLDPIDEDCLKCICTSLVSCDKTTCEAGSCGPYEITEAYWADSGSLTTRGRLEEGFLGCVSNRVCAKKTVQNYMQKFARDCNNDGKVNCIDYAAVHIQGPYACGQSYEFGPKIETCYAKALAERVNNPRIVPIDAACLSCICYATTKCDEHFTCSQGECGIYRINKLYWEEAGSPKLVGDDKTTPDAFKRCVLNPHCAGITLTGYVSKYIKDCNGDGVVNCYDYMATHFIGANCVGEVDPGFLSRFQNCRIRTSVIAEPGS